MRERERGAVKITDLWFFISGVLTATTTLRFILKEYKAADKTL
jgi:hypothetical protein